VRPETPRRRTPGPSGGPSAASFCAVRSRTSSARRKGSTSSCATSGATCRGTTTASAWAATAARTARRPRPLHGPGVLRAEHALRGVRRRRAREVGPARARADGERLRPPRCRSSRRATSTRLRGPARRSTKSW
jgi:hypothetical protein